MADLARALLHAHRLRGGRSGVDSGIAVGTEPCQSPGFASGGRFFRRTTDSNTTLHGGGAGRTPQFSAIPAPTPTPTAWAIPDTTPTPAPPTTAQTQPMPTQSTPTSTESATPATSASATTSPATRMATASARIKTATMTMGTFRAPMAAGSAVAVTCAPSSRMASRVGICRLGL